MASADRLSWGERGAFYRRYHELVQPGSDLPTTLDALSRAIVDGEFDGVIARERLSLWLDWLADRLPNSSDPALLRKARAASKAVVGMLDRSVPQLLVIAWTVAQQAQRHLESSTNPGDVRFRALAWSQLIIIIERDHATMVPLLLLASEQASEALEKLGEPEALLHFRQLQARSYLLLDRPAEGLYWGERMLPLAEQHAGPTERGNWRMHIADCLTALGHAPEALPLYDAALPLLEQGGSQEALDAARMYRAMCLQSLGRADEALAEFAAVLPSMRRHAGSSTVATMLANYGSALADRGQFAESRACYEEALALFARLDNESGQYRCALGICRCVALLGYPEGALRMVEQIVPQVQASEQPQLYAVAASFQVGCLAMLERDEEGLAIYKDLLPLVKALADKSDYALMLGCAATLLGRSRMRRWDAAPDWPDPEALFRESIAHFAEPHSSKYAGCLCNFACFLQDHGRYEESRDYLLEALPLLVDSGAAAMASIAHSRLARSCAAAEQYEEAHAHLEAARQILVQLGVGAEDQFWRFLYDRAVFRWRWLGDDDGAREDIVQAGAIVEALSGKRDRFFDVFYVRATYSDIYRMAALLHHDDPHQAFDFAQRAKSRALGDLLNRRVATRTAKESDTGDRRSIDARAEAGRRDWFAGHPFAALGRLLPQSKGANRAPSPVLPSPPPAPTSSAIALAQLQDCLRADEAFLDCLSLMEGSIVVTLHTKARGIAGRLEIEADEVDTLLRSFNGRLAPALTNLRLGTPLPPDNLSETLLALRQLLLGPFEQSGALDGVKVLMVSPSGGLYGIPWGTLLSMGQGMGADGAAAEHAGPGPEVCLMPSATALWLLRQSPREAEPRARLVAFAPFDAATAAATWWDDEATPLDDLSASGAEVNAVAALFRQASPAVPPEVYLSGQARRETLLARAGHADLLLIATHGTRLGAGQSTLDFALLFPPDAAFPGRRARAVPLTMSELFTGSLRLRPGSHVTLTACHLGQVMARGEEAIGIAQAFLTAGATTCLAALWFVHDAVARTFSQAFHEALLAGATPSVALRQARDLVRSHRRWQHPVYWAGFLLVGDGAHAPFLAPPDTPRQPKLKRR